MTHVLIVCGLVFAALLVFSRSFGSDLVFDSRVVIGDDIRLRAWNGENLHRIFTENYWWPSMRSNLYRPLTTLSFAFEYSILGFQDKPMGYQLVNLMLHCTAGGLLLQVLLRLGLSLRPAALLALWFLIHPYATEIVPNVVGRSDLFALIAMLVAMLAYLRVLDETVKPMTGLAWVVGASLVGVFSKENTASVLGLIAWHGLTLGRERLVELRRQGVLRGRHLAATALGVLVILAGVIVPKLIFKEYSLDMDVIGADNPLRVIGWWNARLNALAIIGQNLWGCLLPLDLSADYSYAQLPLAVWPWAGHDWVIVGWAVGALAFGLLGLATWRRVPALSFAIGAAFVLLLPTSNLLVDIGTVKADRLVYPALPAAVFAFGFIAVAAWRRVTSNFTPEKSRSMVRLWGAGLAIAVVVLGLFTHLRGSEWRTAESFWAGAFATAPKSFKTMAGHAALLSRRGDLAEADEAVRLSTQAMDIIAGGKSIGISRSGRLAHLHAGIFVERGTLLLEAGRREEAARDFLEAEHIFRGLVDDLAKVNENMDVRTKRTVGGSMDSSLDMMAPMVLLCELMRHRGATAEAADLLERYLSYNRLLPEYLQSLGRALVEKGDWERGLDFLLEASLLKPNDKFYSGEAAWVWANHTLPPTGLPMMTDQMKAGTPTLPMINLNDSDLARLTEQAASRISKALLQRELFLEERAFVRQMRYRVGQPDWLR